MDAGVSATINSTLNDSAGLVKTGPGTLTVNGQLSGTGSITATGGSLTLASPGGISYTGQTIVSNGATLTFASPAIAAPINSTAFFVNGPSGLIVNAVSGREDIQGTVTFDSTGGGTIDFTGSTAFGGVVMAGNLTIVSTGGAQDRVISSSGVGLNINLPPKTLTLNTADPASSLLVSSLLWNRGNLTKIGPGTAILTFANTYNGVTTLSGGILSVSSLANGGIASNIGQSTKATANLVFDSGTLQYTGTGASTDRLFTLTTNGGGIDASGSGPLTFSNTGAVALSGTGARSLTLTGGSTGANTFAPVLGDSGGPTSLVKAGAGTWVLAGANTNTGGTAINGGALQVSADTNLGAATGPLSFNGGTLATTNTFTSARITTLDAGGGTIDVAPTTTLTMNGAIGGTGAFTKIDTGTLVLTGTNTYTGGTTISQGTLQLGDGTTNGSIVGNVADNSTLAFDPATRTTVSFGGVISGSGSVNQIGTGTTVLTGANSFSGGTLITAGTLQIGNGGTAGSITGSVTDNGTLAFNCSGDKETFDGLVSGSGDLVKLGSDTLVLTANNTYSGGFRSQYATIQTR
jgi:autotransporter-associated beta strand protein